MKHIHFFNPVKDSLQDSGYSILLKYNLIPLTKNILRSIHILLTGKRV
jgi:hypothetical protein